MVFFTEFMHLSTFSVRWFVLRFTYGSSFVVWFWHYCFPTNKQFTDGKRVCNSCSDVVTTKGVLMFKMTIRSKQYNIQLLVKKFGRHTKKTLRNKVKQLNLQKFGKKMAKIFGPGKPRKLNLPWAY